MHHEPILRCQSSSLESGLPPESQRCSEEIPLSRLLSFLSDVTKIDESGTSKLYQVFRRTRLASTKVVPAPPQILETSSSSWANLFDNIPSTVRARPALQSCVGSSSATASGHACSVQYMNQRYLNVTPRQTCLRSWNWVVSSWSEKLKDTFLPCSLSRISNKLR